MDEQVSLSDTVVLSAGMLGFGFACVWSLYLVRASRWATRDSRLAREVRTPPRGCLQMRMHFLVHDPAQSAALATAVGALPPRAKILAFKQTPASNAFLRVLEMEQTPVLAIGPGGVVFRISHRLPLQTEYASLYAKDKWEDVVEEVRSIDRKVKDSMGTTAPMTVVVYAVPDVHGLVDEVSFPFPIEKDSVFGTLQTDERVALLCLHTDNATEDHCRM